MRSKRKLKTLCLSNVWSDGFSSVIREVILKAVYMRTLFIGKLC